MPGLSYRFTCNLCNKPGTSLSPLAKHHHLCSNRVRQQRRTAARRKAKIEERKVTP